MPKVDHCIIKRSKAGYYRVILMDSSDNKINTIELLSKKKAKDECRRIYQRIGKTVALSDSD